MINSVVPTDQALIARTNKFNTILSLSREAEMELSW